jgi:putative two-component system response regulator
MKIQTDNKEKYKILCADAAGSELQNQLRSLCGRDCELLHAEDGHEALMLLKLHGDSIRLAVINSLLPVIDGLSLCASLRKNDRWRKLPVILTTDFEYICPEELQTEETDILRRPFSKAKLSEKLDRHLTPLNKQWVQFSRQAPKALVVDDTEHVRTLLRKYLDALSIRVTEADSGASMDVRLSQEKPDFILLDVMMPGEDGLTILKRLRKDPETRQIPIIIVSGIGDVDVVADALEHGAVDYLTKPICSRRLTARVKNCLDGLRLKELERKRRAELQQMNSLLQKRVETYMDGLKESQHGTIFALSKLAESRDPETGEHLERLQLYCRAICEGLRLRGQYIDILSDEFVENLAAASPLHDIGKVGIPDAVLLKPGRLTYEEFEIMKTHAQIGADTLLAAAGECGNNPLLEMGVEIAQFHHEKWDGSGYPTRLSGSNIPLSARILALGDVYDALTSKRVYKEAFCHEKSKAIILEGRGSHFDPNIVDAFLSVEAHFREIRQTYTDCETTLERVAS